MAINLPIISTFDNKGVNGAVGAIQGLGKKLLGLGALVAGAFVVREVVSFAKESILAAEAVETANNRLKAIAKATGVFGAETDKVTSSLIKFAEAQELRIAVDAEVIKGVQAQLLSFKKLSASAGETGGVFERVTQAAFDMAAAGFGSAESNAIALGKAFEDPIRGLTALRRSGTVFTEEQQKLIKTLVESGDTLAAQEVILKELETQYGGTAAATADASVKMGLAFDNIKEALGKALLPAFQRFADYFITQVQPPLVAFFENDFPRIIDKASRAFAAVKPVFDEVGRVLKEALGIDQDSSVLEGLLDKMADFEASPEFAANLEAMVDGFNDMLPSLKELVPLMAQLAKEVVPLLLDILPTLIPVITFLVQVLGHAWNAAQQFGDEVGKTVGEVPTWGQGLVAFSPFAFGFAKHWQFMQDSVSRARIQITAGLDLLRFSFQMWGEAITRFFQGLPAQFGAAISGAIGVLTERGRQIMDGLRNGITSAWGAVSSWVSGIPGRIRDAIGNAGSILYGAGRSIIDGLLNGLSSAWNAVRNWVVDKANWIKNTFANVMKIRSPSKVFFEYGENIVQGLVNGLESFSPKVDVAMAGITPIPDGGFASMPGGVASPSGGITVIVNAGMGTNGAEVGRLIVNSIRDYERRNGAVFAAA